MSSSSLFYTSFLFPKFYQIFPAKQKLGWYRKTPLIEKRSPQNVLMSLSLHHECIYHCSFLLSFGFCQRTCVNIGIIITKWYYDFNGQQKKILWWKRIIVCWVQQRILFEIYLYVNFMLNLTSIFHEDWTEHLNLHTPRIPQVQLIL